MKRHRSGLLIAAVAVAVVASTAWAAEVHGPVQIASLGPHGGNGPHSVQFSIGAASGDGRSVFFETRESLVATDTDEARDVYEAKRGVVRLVSGGSGAGNGPYDAFHGGSSRDGTRAFFHTHEALTPNDTDGGLQDVYEWAGGSTALVSATPDCFECNATFEGASDDGRHVFFEAGGQIWERSAGETRHVSTGPTANRSSIWAEARFLGNSSDGSRAFFWTRDGLVPEDDDRCDFSGFQGPCADIYARTGGETHLVSTGPAAANGPYDVSPLEPFATSKDGRHAVFATPEPLVPEDTDTSVDIYERVDAQTRLVSTGPLATDSLSGPFLGRGPYTVSEDGSRIFFVTDERLVAEDLDASGSVRDRRDVYMRSGDTTTLVSAGPPGDDSSGETVLSRATPDGTQVVFSTTARLAAEDTDSASDVYKWSGAAPELVSIGSAGGNASCEPIVSACWASAAGLSDDGERVVFFTAESLVAADTDAAGDVYERSRGRTALVSGSRRTGNGPFSASPRAVSADGKQVFFSTAEPLSRRDADGQIDVFLAIMSAP